MRPLGMLFCRGPPIFHWDCLGLIIIIIIMTEVGPRGPPQEAVISACQGGSLPLSIPSALSGGDLSHSCSPASEELKPRVIQSLQLQCCSLTPRRWPFTVTSEVNNKWWIPRSPGTSHNSNESLLQVRHSLSNKSGKTFWHLKCHGATSLLGQGRTTIHSYCSGPLTERQSCVSPSTMSLINCLVFLADHCKSQPTVLIFVWGGQ